MSNIPNTRKTPFDHTYSYWPFDNKKLTIRDAIDCVRDDCWAIRLQNGRVLFNSYGLDFRSREGQEQMRIREEFLGNPDNFLNTVKEGDVVIISMFNGDGWDIHALKQQFGWEVRCYRDESI